MVTKVSTITSQFTRRPKRVSVGVNTRLELAFDVGSVEDRLKSFHQAGPHVFLPHKTSVDADSSFPDYIDRNFMPPGGFEGFGQPWQVDHRIYGGLYRNRGLRRPNPGPDFVLKDKEDQARQMVDAGYTYAYLELVGLENQAYWTEANLMCDAINNTVKGKLFTIPMLDPSGGTVQGATPAFIARSMSLLTAKPSQLIQPDGSRVVSIFKPEANSATHWAAVKDECLKLGFRIVLWGCYVENMAATAGNYNNVLDVHGRWGDRDPVSIGNSGNNNRGGAQYIRDTFNKDVLWYVAPGDDRPREQRYWEARNTEAFRVSWDSCIRGNGTAFGKARYVQVPTLDDYAEGAMIGPTRNAGFSWMDLGRYWLEAFYFGNYPQILRPQVYLSHKVGFYNDRMKYTAPLPYEHYVPAPGQPNPRGRSIVEGATPPVENIEAVAFNREPARLWIARGTGATRVVSFIDIPPTEPGKPAVYTVPLVAGGPGSIESWQSSPGTDLALPGTYIKSPWAVSREGLVQDESLRIGNSRRPAWSSTYPDIIPDQNAVRIVP